MMISAVMTDACEHRCSVAETMDIISSDLPPRLPIWRALLAIVAASVTCWSVLVLILYIGITMALG
jgi:hypothetical protein